MSIFREIENLFSEYYLKTGNTCKLIDDYNFEISNEQLNKSIDFDIDLNELIDLSKQIQNDYKTNIFLSSTNITTKINNTGSDNTINTPAEVLKQPLLCMSDKGEIFVTKQTITTTRTNKKSPKLVKFITKDKIIHNNNSYWKNVEEENQQNDNIMCITTKSNDTIKRKQLLFDRKIPKKHACVEINNHNLSVSAHQYNQHKHITNTRKSLSARSYDFKKNHPNLKIIKSKESLFPCRIMQNEENINDFDTSSYYYQRTERTNSTTPTEVTSGYINPVINTWHTILNNSRENLFMLEKSTSFASEFNNKNNNDNNNNNSIKNNSNNSNNNNNNDNDNNHNNNEAIIKLQKLPPLNIKGTCKIQKMNNISIDSVHLDDNDNQLNPHNIKYIECKYNDRKASLIKNDVIKNRESIDEEHHLKQNKYFMPFVQTLVHPYNTPIINIDTSHSDKKLKGSIESKILFSDQTNEDLNISTTSCQMTDDEKLKNSKRKRCFTRQQRKRYIRNHHITMATMASTSISSIDDECNKIATNNIENNVNKIDIIDDDNHTDKDIISNVIDTFLIYSNQIVNIIETALNNDNIINIYKNENEIKKISLKNYNFDNIISTKDNTMKKEDNELFTNKTNSTIKTIFEIIRDDKIISLNTKTTTDDDQETAMPSAPKTYQIEELDKTEQENLLSPKRNMCKFAHPSGTPEKVIINETFPNEIHKQQQQMPSECIHLRTFKNSYYNCNHHANFNQNKCNPIIDDKNNFNQQLYSRNSNDNSNSKLIKTINRFCSNNSNNDQTNIKETQTPIEIYRKQYTKIDINNAAAKFLKSNNKSNCMNKISARYKESELISSDEEYQSCNKHDAENYYDNKDIESDITITENSIIDDSTSSIEYHISKLKLLDTETSLTSLVSSNSSSHKVTLSNGLELLSNDMKFNNVSDEEF